MAEPRYILIASLPRSRSAWLANFLSTGDAFFMHDPSQFCHENIALFRSTIDAVDTPIIGCVDTGLPLFWHHIAHDFVHRDVTFAYLYRDPDEIKASLTTLGFDRTYVENLIDIEIQAFTLMRQSFPGIDIPSEELSNLDSLDEIFSTLLPDQKFNPIRAAQLTNTDVRVRPQYMKNVLANYTQ